MKSKALKDMGARLREYRLGTLEGIESREVAKACKLSAPMYCQIESGNRRPSVATLLDMYQATGIDLHWLVTGELRGNGDG